MDNKKRLFEMFERVNKIDLKEWYDDEYFAGPEPPSDVDPHDDRQMQELHVLFSKDGIPDIYDELERGIVDLLKDNGYIAEDPQSYAWFFTPEGMAAFPTWKEFQRWLISGTEGDYGVKGGDDSEAPYLRGREPMSEAVLPVKKKEEIISEFVNFVNEYLEYGTGNEPNVVISNDPEEAANMFSFGKFTPMTGEIRVVATNRNLADVLRTLAHEMVHHKQNLQGRLHAESNEDGSDTENEANAQAAIIMRKFGKANPIIFE